MPVAKVALPLPLDQLFDYWVPEGLDVPRGAVVRVRLGRGGALGVVLDATPTGDFATGSLQPIDEVVDQVSPLPEELCDLAEFVARYYQQPIGLCCGLLLPPLGIGVARKSAPAAAGKRQGAGGEIPLNPEQRAALGVAWAEGFGVTLLQGVTGSGKTEVYMAAATRAIERGGQALFLVPEINLTPQLVQRLAAALPAAVIAVLHSRLAAGERRRSWHAAASGTASLVLATRLGVFAPLPRLALIVVDEEHDPSYKQQDGVRYHARDVAIYRASRRGVPIVLGSATPSLESHVHALSGRYRHALLPHRARPSSRLPQISLAPARGSDVLDGMGAPLRAALTARLARGEQSLVFVNRRGYAPSLLCVACGWKAMCDACAARLVVHREAASLVCHHCGATRALVVACPDCGNTDLLPAGFGTERLAAALSTMFPAARIARVDADTTRRKHAFADVRDAVAAGEVDILVGTQMLAKGHDFPRLSLVGILGADNALYSGAFRAAERLFATLTQVAGRAGRDELPGEVIVQTDFPSHAIFQALLRGDYDAFAATQLAEREASSLPPCSHLALLAAEARDGDVLMAFLQAAAGAGRALAQAQHPQCVVHPPVPAPLSRRAGFERAQVLAQSVDRRALQAFLPAWRSAIAAHAPRSVRWALDVDPIELD